MTPSLDSGNRPVSSQPYRIKRRKNLTANVGLFAVGHKDYWAQFEGLHDELMRHHREIAGRIQAHGVTVTDFGMVDEAATAYRKVKDLLAKNETDK